MAFQSQREWGLMATKKKRETTPNRQKTDENDPRNGRRRPSSGHENRVFSSKSECAQTPVFDHFSRQTAGPRHDPQGHAAPSATGLGTPAGANFHHRQGRRAPPTGHTAQGETPDRRGRQHFLLSKTAIAGIGINQRNRLMAIVKPNTFASVNSNGKLWKYLKSCSGASRICGAEASPTL